MSGNPCLSPKSRQGVPVISPDRLSPAAVARVMSEVLDRPVRVRQSDLAGYRATMARYGMSEAWAQGPADTAASRNDGSTTPSSTP